MKNNIVFAIALVMAVLGSSCKKQLEEVPKNFLTPDQFFQSDQDAIQGVNGAYTCLIRQGPIYMYQQFLWQFLDEACDALRLPNSPAVTLSVAPWSYANNFWSGYYKGIYTTSQIIDKVPRSGSSVLKDRSVGEARFLRALFYYYATCTFGDVPLVTERNYSDLATASSLARTSADSVRAFMIDDLLKAIAVLPDTYSSGSDKGRATKGAAQTLLVKTYLWRKDWAKAEQVAQDIEASHTYKLLPEYADVFKENNEFNQESIFEINFEPNLLPSFQADYYEPNNTVGVAPFSTNVWFRIYVPFQSFANSFEPGDKRKDVEIATGYNGQAFTPDVTNRVSLWFGPKWWRLSATRKNSGLDIYHFRYADVLLMLAEAANELGHTSIAEDAINEVRERAGLPDLSGLSKDDFRTALQKERGVELCGEGHRRFDLVRWGIWYEATKAAALPEEPVLANSLQPYMDLLPIPQAEISLNPHLTQNPGWQ